MLMSTIWLPGLPAYNIKRSSKEEPSGLHLQLNFQVMDQLFCNQIVGLHRQQNKEG